MSDLLVIGYDLSAHRTVDISEREVWEWYEKGHNGDRSLICYLCYLETDTSGEYRIIALVPKGRDCGRRRSHFAHPPGLAPPGGHAPETVWHHTVKHRLRALADQAGAASARVEEYTPDGRRRSDVAITMTHGVQIAIEVQQGEIRDGECLDRQRDHDRNAIAVSWVWRPGMWIPQVLYRIGQPGWLFDLDKDRLGLICGKPSDHTTAKKADGCNFQSAHWPPCPGDETEIRWMPASEAQFSAMGLQPSRKILAQLNYEAVESQRKAQAKSAPKAAFQQPRPPAVRVISAPPTPRILEKKPERTTNLVQRIDAKPPGSPPEERMYYCPACGYLTGVQLRESRIPHEIASPDRTITKEDLEPHLLPPGFDSWGSR